MKYLNKIIFINSAHIPYAEIAVDGNVHFTGTQGVGKSTVLRALLFFYNADKHRLGIQVGQKSFDEFYFRQSNSYILYEVMRDKQPYTILVSRYQGRASWRFIDAPYQRQWLIDSDHRVLSDWIKIRERIDPNVAVSPRIESGVMFKDILFGNTRESKYVRYALVQSAHYQNIPRSIQNVFLNTKLDADFVKNTIIQSMADEDLPIDLQTYRRLVTDFEREYDEIDCWFRQSRDGRFPVREQALKIADMGRTLVALDQQLLEVWCQLNDAVSHSEQQIPLIQEETESLSDAIAKEQDRVRTLTAEFDKERDSLNQELGAKKSKLREIAAMRKEFDAMGMEEKERRARRESAIRQEVADQKVLLDNLLKRHATIEEKYQIARGKLQNARQAFHNGQQETYFQQQALGLATRKRLEEERTQGQMRLMEALRSWRRESDERLQQLLADQHRADSALRELRQWHPLAEEMKQIDQALQQLILSEKEYAAQQTAVHSQMEQIRAEYAMKEAELQSASQHQQESLQQQRTEIRHRLEQVDALLSRLDGSLYSWLCQHVAGWEQHIGKVVDAERILYAQELDPQLGPSSESLFGVRIALDRIDDCPRTPDDYRREKYQLTESLQSVDRQLHQLPLSLEEEHQKLGKRYAVRLNPLRQQATHLRVGLDQIPQMRQQLQNQLHSLRMQEQEQIAHEKEQRERLFNEALLQVQHEKEQRERQEAKHKKDLKGLDAIFTKATKAVEEELRCFQASQRAEAEARNRTFDSQLQQLSEQQQAELAGKGVDMQLLDSYRRALESLQLQLTQIEAERPLVIRYRDAEQQLFAREPLIREEIKEIEQQLLQVRQRYDDKRIRIEKRLRERQERQRNLLRELAQHKEGLEQYHQMVDHEHLVPDVLLAEGTTVATQQTCRQLLSQLRGVVNQKRQAFDRLKEEVVSFNRYFKPQNAFHFNTLPVADADFLQIAVDLQEFIDNNKIEEFRRRTSEHYKDILGRIAAEMGALLKRRSDVDGVILDINRDFVEKNFAGVIKSIELRANESSDRLMQLLLSIHAYTVENALSMGELNLFSSDNRDEVNRKVVDYLKSLSHQLQNEPARREVSLGDAFRLQFRVKENDNDTLWVERIKNVGSDGTDILVKAMVNIMLINVFKKKAIRKSGDFVVHCMMDEIGRLHPTNIKGILQFANSRNIYLINSSPTSYNPYDYRYTYLLSKQGVQTRVERLLKRIQ